MVKSALILISCALLFVICPARADQWNKKTVVTFSSAVELPGVVLPAGTYVFKLVDSISDRHIVQVLNEDETKVFTTILAIPNYQLEPREETIMRFEERPKNAAGALRAWFYPGDNFGQEFVYPKARAAEIAEEVMLPVLAAAVTPELKAEELAKTPVETIAPPVAEETTSLWNVPDSTGLKAEAEPEPAPAPRELPEIPATASPMPLIALLGLTSLGFAAYLKRA